MPNGIKRGEKTKSAVEKDLIHSQLKSNVRIIICNDSVAQVAAEPKGKGDKIASKTINRKKRLSIFNRL